MKITVIFVLVILFFSVSAVLAQPNPDEMRVYYIAFLKKGPNWTAVDSPERVEIQKGHMEHIQNMAATGKLILAGPFIASPEFQGMFVFKTDTIEEAIELANQDPAVKSGRLRLEFHQWYSSKGINVNPELE